MTKTAADYRIEEIQRVTLNNKEVKLFKAFEKGDEGRFFYVGQFTAPARTANADLWKFVGSDQ